MTTISEKDAANLLQKMREVHRVIGPLPGEFTCRQFSEANDITDRSAERELETLRRDGKLNLRRVGRLKFYSFTG